MNDRVLPTMTNDVPVAFNDIKGFKVEAP